MGLDVRMAALPASGSLGIEGADYLSILLRAEQCPHNARTMPAQCPHNVFLTVSLQLLDPIAGKSNTIPDK